MTKKCPNVKLQQILVKLINLDRSALKGVS